MKTKLLALLLIAGGSMFAAHISVGVGIGVGPAYGYYAPAPPPALRPPGRRGPGPRPKLFRMGKGVKRKIGRHGQEPCGRNRRLCFDLRSQWDRWNLREGRAAGKRKITR